MANTTVAALNAAIALVTEAVTQRKMPASGRGIVDELGPIDEAIKALGARQKSLREAAAMLGRDSIAGHSFELAIKRSTTVTLSAPLVKALLSPKQIADCSTTGSRTEFKVKRRTPNLQAVA